MAANVATPFGLTSMALAVTLTIIALALALLIAFIVRQERKARRIEKTLDYSKVREWHDDDDDPR